MTCNHCGGNGYCPRCDGHKVIEKDGDYELCEECYGDGYCVICEGYMVLDD